MLTIILAQKILKLNDTNTEVVTARSWENLSHAITAYEQLGQTVDEKMIYQYIKSEEVTFAFYKYFWMYQQSMEQNDINEIMQGKNLNTYIDRANERGIKYQWNLTEILTKQLELCVQKKEKNATVSKKIENVFSFLKGLTESTKVVEKFFLDISASHDLLLVLSKVKNEEYLNYCRKAYGGLFDENGLAEGKLLDII